MISEDHETFLARIEASSSWVGWEGTITQRHLNDPGSTLNLHILLCISKLIVIPGGLPSIFWVGQPSAVTGRGRARNALLGFSDFFLTGAEYRLNTPQPVLTSWWCQISSLEATAPLSSFSGRKWGQACTFASGVRGGHQTDLTSSYYS